jgi:antirestriction protein ArdC
MMALPSPYNTFTRHQYTRGNIVILTAAAEAAGFVIPAWLTRKEVEKLGGTIRGGELGQQIYFAGHFHPQRTDNDDEKEADRKFSKNFTVYNIEQCEFGEEVYSHLGDLRQCFAHIAELSHRERDFVKSLSKRPYPLSERQRTWLDDILGRFSE